MKCVFCDDIGWVCEDHPNMAWDIPDGCQCGAPGAPCPACNSRTDAPRLPKGFKTEFDIDGWRH